MFEKGFDRYACIGDSISCEVDGLTVTARIEWDDCADPPWEDDCHGPVSEWTSRPKCPGERVLHRDGQSYRYYDWEEAIAIAKRDGWDAPPYGEGTTGQRAERAVKKDFDVLKRWCNDDWCYVGIVLSVSVDDVVLDDHAASIWRTEMNYPGADNSYLTDLANEMLGDAVERGKAVLEGLCIHNRRLLESLKAMLTFKDVIREHRPSAEYTLLRAEEAVNKAEGRDE